MINLQFLTDKPLISVFEAVFQGKTGRFLSKNKMKSIDYVEVQSDFLDISALRYIPFKKILSVGDNAITIANNLCINAANEIDTAGYITLSLGLPVYSSTGNFFGNLKDVVLNESGQVFLLQAENLEFTPDRIKSISDNMLILGEKAPQKKVPKKITIPDENQPVEMLNSPIESPQIFDEILVVESMPQSIENSFVGGEIASTPISTPARLISDYRFLLGRIVTEDIYSQKHENIVRNGTVITAAVVERARLFGRLVELTINSKS